MLIDQIKARMFQAIKAGAHVEKEILRVAMGEITTEAARPGRLGTDEEVLTILRKLVKSNEETLAATTDAERRAVLTQENEILGTYLPKSLGLDEIIAALAPVVEQIKAAGNDGQATGIAMKQLKSTGAVVNGKDVGAAIKELRKA
ncbi:MAG: GatB/YqeY domain-containing protein [Polyangiaceae bacterium]